MELHQGHRLGLMPAGGSAGSQHGQGASLQRQERHLIIPH